MSNKFQKKVFNRALKKLRHEMGIELIAALKQKLATSPLVFGNPIVVNQTANTELSLSYDGVECGTYVIDYTSSFIKGNLQVCNDYYDITRMFTNYDTINDTVGGCIIHLGPYRYLSHRALQPTLNSSFLTFKCPYLNDIITMNIKNQPEIRIERMDDFHMIGHQTILLS